MDPILTSALLELGKAAWEYRTKKKLAEVNAAEAIAEAVRATTEFKTKSTREAFEEGRAAALGGHGPADGGGGSQEDEIHEE